MLFIYIIKEFEIMDRLLWANIDSYAKKLKMINCSSQLLCKILLASILILNIFFISNFDKGIESTDESYLLLYALYPDNIIGRLTNFGIISEKILYLLNFNIFYFRIAGFLMLASCSFILIKSFLFFYNTRILC